MAPSALHYVLVVFIVLGVMIAAGSSLAQAQQDIVVQASVDRTALWVGDRVTYTVEITCASHVDILADDLASEKLKLEGLVVLSFEHERSTGSSADLKGPLPKTTHRFRYALATYEVGEPALRIGDLAVRYYVRRPGQRLEDAAPAGEARVPGAVLAWRSTIPDGVEVRGARDTRAPDRTPSALRWVRSVGLALLLVSAAPVVLWSVSLMRHVRPQWSRRRAREARHLTHAALDELQYLDVTADEVRREAYGRLDAALRRHVTEIGGVAAASLTSTEIAASLRANGSSVPVDIVDAVLRECERARYGPPATLPPAERFRETLVTARELVAQKKGSTVQRF